MSWKSLIVGGAIGYVLGARAGRGRYEQITHVSSKTWNSKPVQTAKDKAKSAAGEAAHGLKDRTESVVRGHDEDDTASDGTVKVTAVEF